jgi:hypothetical protein
VIRLAGKDVFGIWVEADVVREPLFDPGGEQIRG